MQKTEEKAVVSQQRDRVSNSGKGSSRINPPSNPQIASTSGQNPNPQSSRNARSNSKQKSGLNARGEVARVIPSNRQRKKLTVDEKLKIMNEDQRKLFKITKKKLERDLEMVYFIFKELWETQCYFPQEKVFFNENGLRKTLFGDKLKPKVVQFIFDNFYFNRQTLLKDFSQTVNYQYSKSQITKDVFGRMKLSEFFEELKKLRATNKLTPFKEFNFIPCFNHVEKFKDGIINPDIKVYADRQIHKTLKLIQRQKKQPKPDLVFYDTKVRSHVSQLSFLRFRNLLFKNFHDELHLINKMHPNNSQQMLATTSQQFLIYNEQSKQFFFRQPDFEPVRLKNKHSMFCLRQSKLTNFMKTIQNKKVHNQARLTTLLKKMKENIKSEFKKTVPFFPVPQKGEKGIPQGQNRIGHSYITYNSISILKDEGLYIQLKDRFYKKQQEKNVNNWQISAKEFKKANKEDSKCQVCNLATDEPTNRNIFCDYCNVLVHCNCVGLSKSPKGDFFCDLCKAFGEKGKYNKCFLCPQRGGVMIKTNLRTDDPFFKKNMSEYVNYHEKHTRLDDNYFEQNQARIISGAISREKQQTLTDQQKYQLGFKSRDRKVVNTNIKIVYDYFKQSYNFGPEELKKNEFSTEYAWMHNTCGYWNNIQYSEMKFRNHSKIFEPNFNKECYICKKTTGSLVQCCDNFKNSKGNKRKQGNRCERMFHAECGRRVKLHMEEDQEAQQAPYCYMYCSDHIFNKPAQVYKNISSVFSKEVYDLYAHMYGYFKDIKDSVSSEIDIKIGQLKERKKVIIYKRSMRKYMDFKKRRKERAEQVKKQGTNLKNGQKSAQKVQSPQNQDKIQNTQKQKNIPQQRVNSQPVVQIVQKKIEIKKQQSQGAVLTQVRQSQKVQQKVEPELEPKPQPGQEPGMVIETQKEIEQQEAIKKPEIVEPIIKPKRKNSRSHHPVVEQITTSTPVRQTPISTPVKHVPSNMPQKSHQKKKKNRAGRAKLLQLNEIYPELSEERAAQLFFQKIMKEYNRKQNNGEVSKIVLKKTKKGFRPRMFQIKQEMSEYPESRKIDKIIKSVAKDNKISKKILAPLFDKYIKKLAEFRKWQISERKRIIAESKPDLSDSCESSKVDLRIKPSSVISFIDLEESEKISVSSVQQNQGQMEGGDRKEDRTLCSYCSEKLVENIVSCQDCTRRIHINCLRYKQFKKFDCNMILIHCKQCKYKFMNTMEVEEEQTKISMSTEVSQQPRNFGVQNIVLQKIKSKYQKKIREIDPNCDNFELSYCNNKFDLFESVDEQKEQIKRIYERQIKDYEQQMNQKKEHAQKHPVVETKQRQEVVLSIKKERHMFKTIQQYIEKKNETLVYNNPQLMRNGDFSTYTYLLKRQSCNPSATNQNFFSNRKE